jgi:hypothetical protein
MDRRAGTRAVTRVSAREQGAWLERCPADARRSRSGDVRQHCNDGAWIDAPGLLDVLEDADGVASRMWLSRWRQLVEEDGADGTRNIDLIQHNLLVADGKLVVIDDELFHDRRDAESVIGRGVPHTTLAIVERRPPSRWKAPQDRPGRFGVRRRRR